MNEWMYEYVHEWMNECMYAALFMFLPINKRSTDNPVILWPMVFWSHMVVSFFLFYLLLLLFLLFLFYLVLLLLLLLLSVSIKLCQRTCCHAWRSLLLCCCCWSKFSTPALQHKLAAVLTATFFGCWCCSCCCIVDILLSLWLHWCYLCFECGYLKPVHLIRPPQPPPSRSLAFTTCPKEGKFINEACACIERQQHPPATRGDYLAIRQTDE